MYNHKEVDLKYLHISNAALLHDNHRVPPLADDVSCEHAANECLNRGDDSIERAQVSTHNVTAASRTGTMSRHQHAFAVHIYRNILDICVWNRPNSRIRFRTRCPRYQDCTTRAVFVIVAFICLTM